MQSELVSLATLQPPNASVTPSYQDLLNSTEWDLVYSIVPPYIFTVCLTGILGNIFVLLVFLLQGSRWSVPEIYLSNLALADLLLLICLPFWAMNILNHFMGSYREIMCKVVNLSINVNMYTSIYMLVMVNVDRYLAFALTMKAMWLRRKSYAKFICVVLWLFGVGMGSPTICMRKLKDIPDHQAVECHMDYPNTTWRLAHLLQLILVGFALPFLVITFCYVNIIWALKQRRHIGYWEDRNDKKATALVCAVTLLFFICWGPFHFMTLLDLLCDQKVLDKNEWSHFLNIGSQFSVYFAFSNSCLNPALYVCSGKYFKRKVSSICNKRKRSLDATALQRTVSTNTTTAN
ncbi:B1 bradykinin receptor-like [Carassius auratus]|uniref:B1 bradykinin receptor-like n=1 Tax=Carassius auratus TaxID=7957 RepID=A0A6P6NJI5_CARAU|nr:B1 bradykinin receptor-like [Carassius auratus]XP_026108296.1 B1 bradykinin receptor-like [Carassius auratus]XP_052385835.1 B1 bradykinin receptor [Carassius gibelio]